MRRTGPARLIPRANPARFWYAVPMGARWLATALSVAFFACGGTGDVAGDLDGGEDSGGADGGGGGPGGSGFVRYPADARHSPITPALADHLVAIAAAAPGSGEAVFAKVGDSITVSTSFLHCFASAGATDLAGRSELEETLAAFRAGDAAGTTPYDRTSAAAGIGWNAGTVLDGAPSPLASEIAAIAPRFAVVMYGTNDVGFENPAWYGENLAAVLDQLIAAGVVPVLSSIPPRDDDAAVDALVPLHDAIALGLAEARQIPFMDFHGALLPLAGHGLAPDGVHPNTYPGGGGCALTADGLQYGYNVRNLLALEGLDRARRSLLGQAPDPDGSGRAPLAGAGTGGDPLVIDGLPFTHAADTSGAAQRELDLYDGCAAEADESGPEVVYRLEVTAPTAVHLVLVDGGEVDVDLHLLRGEASTAACVERNDRAIRRTLEPGTWFVVVDTYVAAGAEQGGAYLLAAVAE